MFPSFLIRFAHVDALAATCRVMFPVGLALSIYSAAILGRVIAYATTFQNVIPKDRSPLMWHFAGVFAAFAVAFLPDAFGQRLGNGWTSYHFFQQVAPGGPYACSTLATSWALLLLSVRTTSRPALLGAIGFGALTLFFKFNLFFVFAAGLLVFFVVFSRAFTLWIRLACASIAVSGYWMLSQLPRFIPTAPSMWFDGSGRHNLLQLIISNFATARGGNGDANSGADAALSIASWNSLLVPALERLRNTLAGAPVLLITEYGIFGTLTLLLATLWLFRCGLLSKRRQPTLSALSPLSPALVAPVLVAPLLVAINHLGFSLTLAANQGVGDPLEFNHKVFIFGYYFTIAWLGAILGQAILGQAMLGQAMRIRLGFFSLLVALLGIWSGIQGRDIQAAAFSGNLTGTTIPSGLLESARYVKLNSAVTDIVQYSKNDSFGVIPAIAERAAYIREPIVNGRVLNSEKLQHRAVELAQALQSDQPLSQLKSLGIQWLILDPADNLPSTDATAEPRFAAGGFRVFSIP